MDCNKKEGTIEFQIQQGASSWNMDHAENCVLNTTWYKVLGSSSKVHEAANNFI
jgi:hypothetical protein